MKFLCNLTGHFQKAADSPFLLVSTEGNIKQLKKKNHLLIHVNGRFHSLSENYEKVLLGSLNLTV